MLFGTSNPQVALPNWSCIRNQVNVQTNDQNKKAVTALLSDANRALALTEVEDVGGGRNIAPQIVATAYKDYIALVRRSAPLTMTDGDLIVFHRKLDQLRTCLYFFGESL